ncbi:hypothetical protein KDL44_15455 [bacterium]|nr:hypothetical protein [bacterium]
MGKQGLLLGMLLLLIPMRVHSAAFTYPVFVPDRSAVPNMFVTTMDYSDEQGYMFRTYDLIAANEIESPLATLHLEKKPRMMGSRQGLLGFPKVFEFHPWLAAVVADEEAQYLVLYNYVEDRRLPDLRLNGIYQGIDTVNGAELDLATNIEPVHLFESMEGKLLVSMADVPNDLILTLLINSISGDLMEKSTDNLAYLSSSKERIVYLDVFNEITLTLFRDSEEATADREHSDLTLYKPKGMPSGKSGADPRFSSALLIRQASPFAPQEIRLSSGPDLRVFINLWSSVVECNELGVVRIDSVKEPFIPYVFIGDKSRLLAAQLYLDIESGKLRSAGEVVLMEGSGS